MENRETFFARLAKPPFSHVLTPRDLRRIELMYVLAKYGHRGQFRKAPVVPGGEPPRYFEHPRGVALILIDEIKLANPTAIICGLGHDCDEDSDQINAPIIAEALGRKIAYRLRLLSKRGKTDDEYKELLWKHSDWITLVDKAADRLHNLRSLPPDNEAFQRKQIAETETDYLPLFRHMVDITPRGLQQDIEHLRFMVQATTAVHREKFRAIDKANLITTP